ncbi:hypothetical protein OHA33_33915 [Streptomyces sp. NBC_00562]|uniref:hypothetical protein n=1 Tax=Streptomyces sp. NBC_00562 TaxID=2975777 RepID=UPI002E820E8A|nr:hypothetical protein [Streptomyces sp. NBC_00562]WUC23456.1 hypothetical protein OHA33_33915 [Streptomyces sp. NBC_00562]
MPRHVEIHDNLLDRLKEVKVQGGLGEVAAIETSVAAKHTTTNLGMPDFHPSAGRRTSGS